ncbi:hypothetical protein SAMN05660463_00518 [Pseudomonas sp. URIL14HWK12:I9]|nr:hypothetical protein F474_00886 [Pseudomonas sp. URIL14HWK12:I12]PVZ27356.1 hypothetical protein F470_00541 [Pseudomonas sp. URIL14HWK12:I10]PVZ38245.1 hypothetical protein F472_00886 [Pseudomonas sp. URIL14HWK12:I11]SNZ04125.1 hypothetical protein SAMN05660463_00518 [Pseudomonas sp. URIL14HWK12:I9]
MSAVNRRWEEEAWTTPCQLLNGRRNPFQRDYGCGNRVSVIPSIAAEARITLGFFPTFFEYLQRWIEPLYQAPDPLANRRHWSPGRPQGCCLTGLAPARVRELNDRCAPTWNGGAFAVKLAGRGCLRPAPMLERPDRETGVTAQASGTGNAGTLCGVRSHPQRYKKIQAIELKGLLKVGTPSALSLAQQE